MKFAVMLLVGTAVAPPVVADDPIISFEEASALLGEGVLVKQLDPAPMPDPHRLLPSRPGRWSYRVTGGDDVGESASIWLRKVDDEQHPNLWQRVREDKRVVSLDGHDKLLGVTSIAVPKHNLLIAFDPHELEIKQGMKQGQTISHRSDVDTYSLNRPSHRRADGYVELDIEYIGRYRLRLPFGEVDAYATRVDYYSKVGPVKQEDTIYNFYAEDLGLVAWVERIDIRAAFVYHEDDRNAFVLIEPPEFDDAAGQNAATDAPPGPLAGRGNSQHEAR